MTTHPIHFMKLLSFLQADKPHSIRAKTIGYLNWKSIQTHIPENGGWEIEIEYDGFSLMFKPAQMLSCGEIHWHNDPRRHCSQDDIRRFHFYFLAPKDSLRKLRGKGTWRLNWDKILNVKWLKAF